MDFEEFLWANNRENIVTFLKSNPTETAFNEILSDLFKQYLYIGGMPEAVADWIENKNVENINAIQEEILGNYRKDFSKYTDNTTAIRIRQVFDTLPAQFAKKNDKFLYGTVKSGARAREYETASQQEDVLNFPSKKNTPKKLPYFFYQYFHKFLQIPCCCSHESIDLYATFIKQVVLCQSVVCF